MVQVRRRSGRRRSHSVLYRVLFVIGLPLLRAATPPSSPPSIEESSLRLTARTSRTHDLLGFRFGIYADLENTSRIPLFLHPRYLTLTSPPELTYHDQGLVKYAYC